ncbi:Hypothetical predicted protein [Podarcis lilfordi]|uniref:Uncharacterized protein n=1 Tax=Podarcis lilfordi TaxID=74358 RepID=A0AA35P5Q9_9SAUR|nr:Hypothetical predicted protein [Podarcis lilfordi]
MNHCRLSSTKFCHMEEFKYARLSGSEKPLKVDVHLLYSQNRRLKKPFMMQLIIPSMRCPPVAFQLLLLIFCRAFSKPQ